MRRKILFTLLLLVALGGGAPAARAETPEEWVRLLIRVHGGFGAFLPVGIRIGEDAMKRLGAGPRELVVTFYQGEGTPCPCSADGIGLAVHASVGQGTLNVAPEKAPAGMFAVALLRPRKGGNGLRYNVLMSTMEKLAEINRNVSDPLARYHAVMAIDDLFIVEPAG